MANRDGLAWGWSPPASAVIVFGVSAKVDEAAICDRRVARDKWLVSFVEPGPSAPGVVWARPLVKATEGVAEGVAGDCDPLAPAARGALNGRCRPDPPPVNDVADEDSALV